MFEEKLLGSRYLLVKKLGAGSFGRTYLARDTMLPDNPICVVKQLNPIFKDRQLLDIAKRLFETEAKTLQKVGDRDRIPQLLAYFTENQEFYLVQQYIKGYPLSEKLIPAKPWSETTVIKLLQNCLDILDYIHSQGVIHRDIKPANLICREQDNKLVLVDFGAAKEVMLAKTKLLSSTVAVGTGGYMPEEQARGRPRFNSDIYALGVIAIEALTGCSPLNLQEDEKKGLIWQPQAKVSNDLEKIISKMTRSNFRHRYQSAGEVIRDLAAHIDPSTTVEPQTPKYYRSTIIEKDISRQSFSEIRENSLPNQPPPNSSQSTSSFSPKTAEGGGSKINNPNNSINPELIRYCKEELANYIGPVSDFVIQDTIIKNPQMSPEQLIEKLAAEIPDSRKAQEFTAILGRSASKISNQNNRINPELIRYCKEELANYIGPLSDFVIQDALIKNPQMSPEQLIEKLAAEIPDSRKAQEFTAILGRSASKTSNQNNSLKPEFIRYCKEELANYIGPLSNFVIKDTLVKNPQISPEQLIEKLTAEIPNSRKAKQFKKNLLGKI